MDKNAIKWIKNLIKKEIGTLILLIVGSVAIAGLGIVFAMLTKMVIDTAMVSNNHDFWFFSIIVVVVIVLQVILNAWKRYATTRLQLRLELHARRELLESIFRKDYLTISKIHSGDLMMHLTSDISLVTDEASSILPNLVMMIARIVLAFMALCYLDWILSLILLILGIIGFVASYFYRKKVKALHIKSQEKETITRSFMQESIESMIIIKSFNGEEKITSVNDEYQADAYKMKLRKNRLSVLAGSCFNMVFQFAYIATLVWCAKKILDGDQFAYGDLTALLQLVGQIQVPFTNISGIMPRYYSMLASAERIIAIENLKEDLNIHGDFDLDFLKEHYLEISFDNVSFGYDEKPIFENVNLKIKKEDFVVINGLSGIGKTTFLRLLLGIYNPTSGRIRVKTKDMSYTIDISTRKLFSYVPQGNFIFSGSILDNLTFFKDKVSKEKIEEALKISESWGFINKLENGLDTVIGEKGVGLSEGQIQRLAIARAIISDAPIILLDEATSALDEGTERKVLENLSNLKNQTCIIVSHKKAAYQICNKEMVFEKNNVTMKSC